MFKDLEDTAGPYQFAANLSTDPNFPGHWLDVGGEPITMNDDSAPVTLTPDDFAAMNGIIGGAADKVLGLVGYYKVSEEQNDGMGIDAGNFYIIGRVTGYSQRRNLKHLCTFSQPMHFSQSIHFS